MFHENGRMKSTDEIAMAIKNKFAHSIVNTAKPLVAGIDDDFLTSYQGISYIKMGTTQYASISTSSLSLSTGAVVGIVIGILALITCICCGLCFTGAIGVGIFGMSKKQGTTAEPAPNDLPQSLEMTRPSTIVNPIYAAKNSKTTEGENVV